MVESRISEEREDIFEENAGRREIGKLAQRLVEAYLKTGEFGGGGGLMGGLSLGFRGIWTVAGRM